MAARVAAALSSLAQTRSGQHVAIVTHGGVLTAIRNMLVNSPKAGMVHNCSISKVRIGLDPQRKGRLIVVMFVWSDISHLACFSVKKSPLKSPKWGGGVRGAQQ